MINDANNIVKTVKNQALMEEAIYSKKSRAYPVKMSKETKISKAKNMPISAFFNKVVDITEEPVVIDLNSGLLPRTVRSTNGFYTITYNPEGSPKRVAGKPYTFGQDMVRGRFCVSGVKHLKFLSKRIPEFKFILKWSNYTDGLFAMAKKHPGIPFPFNLNWSQYGDMIEAKAEKMGIDIDHKPFLIYITRKEKMTELREKYKMYPNPERSEYQSVLDEVDKEEKIYD